MNFRLAYKRTAVSNVGGEVEGLEVRLSLTGALYRVKGYPERVSLARTRAVHTTTCFYAKGLSPGEKRAEKVELAGKRFGEE